jgi:two-component system phosphate regulon sensor histidine kinase PhoR
MIGELLIIGAVLGVGTTLGALLGNAWPGLWLATAACLAYELRRRQELVALIRRHRRLSEPFPRGLWGEIYRDLARLQSRSRKRKRGLARFAARFREAAAAVPDALVLLDSQQRIDWCNPAARSLLGIAWPEDDGRPVSQISLYPLIQDLIEAADYGRALECVCPENEALVLSVHIAPFGGKKKQRLIVGRDVTKVYHLNQIRRDFVANVSHELRTPLTVISGFLENMLGEESPDRLGRRPLELMQHQTRRMQTLTEDLLALSRLELDEKASDLARLDVAALAEQALTDARVLSASRAHRFELDADRSLLLQANEGELRSVLANLLFNAVIHTPAGTRVSVFWGREDLGAILSVTDDGPGIHAEHIPRLTERFYRVDKGRSRQSGGTGLGLAIVKHVLSRHGAELRIASREGEGSTFSCHFPVDLLLRKEEIGGAPGVGDAP